jgi:hypothetical protein
MNVFFYKLTVDDGGAPCVQQGLLSLAICKPMIRGKAVCGDLIFGFSAKSQHSDNRLLYIARITDKKSNGTYYTTRRYANRDDCIYRYTGKKFVWRKGALYHGHQMDLVHDLGDFPKYGRAHVLLSRDFRYFGRNGSAEYKSLYPRVRVAVEQLGQGHRVHHGADLREELLALAKRVWRENSRKVLGSPTTRPSRKSCHRSRACGEC